MCEQPDSDGEISQPSSSVVCLDVDEGNIYKVSHLGMLSVVSVTESVYCEHDK